VHQLLERFIDTDETEIKALTSRQKYSTKYVFSVVIPLVHVTLSVTVFKCMNAYERKYRQFDMHQEYSRVIFQNV
jgi:hypothetical protein